MYPKESLEIISKMMNDTRLNVMRNAYMPLLVWGWVSFGVSLIVYLGHTLTGNPDWDFAWFLIPIAGAPIVRYNRPADKGISTAISGSMKAIWKMFTILIVAFSIASFAIRFNVLAVILLILAIGSFITGELIRYPFLKYSSIPGFILAATLWAIPGLTEIPVFGIAMLIMMVLPAYKIKQELRK